MNADPLSARLNALANDIEALAHTVAALDPRVGAQAVYLAVRAGLAAVAAQAQERTIRRHEHALEELHANELEEEAKATPAPPPNAAHQATINALKATLPGHRA